MTGAIKFYDLLWIVPCVLCVGISLFQVVREIYWELRKMLFSVPENTGITEKRSATPFGLAESEVLDGDVENDSFLARHKHDPTIPGTPAYFSWND